MFEHVVVGADFSDGGLALIRSLPGLRRLGTTRLRLVHSTGVRHPTIGLVGQLASTRQRLEEIRHTLKNEGFEVAVEVVMGDPARELTRIAVERGGSLIMVGSRSHSRVQEAFIGSVTSGVIRLSPIPTLVHHIPPEPEAEDHPGGILLDIRNVVFPTDLSAGPERAFARLEEIAGNREISSYLLLHIRETSEDESNATREDPVGETMRRMAGRLRNLGAGSVEIEILTGDPATEIVRAADSRGQSLIVMATHGKGVIADAILGSVSHEVVRRTRLPVLLIPARSRSA